MAMLSPVATFSPPRPKLFSVGASNQAVPRRFDGNASETPMPAVTGATCPKITSVV